MDITEVKVLPIEGDERLKAFVTIKFDDVFIIRDVKIIDGNTGLFVAMPAKKMKDGTYRDLVHPLNAETRTDLDQKVIQEYEQVIANGSFETFERNSA